MTASELPADELRSQVYALLGALLAGPPKAEFLQRLAGIGNDAGNPPVDDALGRAWQSLGEAARRADIDSLDDEYHDLFIGIARGELVPYASWYLTGLLMEQPLADLRNDLQRLGIRRQDEVHEPEDHAGALCQVMALLAHDRSAGQTNSGYREQHRFVGRHLAPWIKRFFQDLEAAGSADFYRSVAQLGNAFIDFEWQYLDLESLTNSSMHEVNVHERA